MFVFKTNPTGFVAALRNGGDDREVDLRADRTYRVQERVTLHPDVEVQDGRPDWLRAEVVAVHEESLRIRAEHSFYPVARDKPWIERGQEVDVDRWTVFAVELTN